MAVQHGTIPPPALQQRAPSLSKKQWAGLILGAVLFALPFFFNIPGLEAPGQRMLSIFLLAIVFWILEPIPLTATAVLVILSLIHI